MRISVVMATYNGAAFLEAQLLSILSGSRPPDEIIIVDDGSTDETVSIAERFMRTYPACAFSISRNAVNIGASATFMRSISSSSGDIVLLCDQDDVWHEEKIATMEEVFARQPSLTMAYSDGEIVDNSGEPTGTTIFSTRSKAHLELGPDRDPLEVACNPDIKGCTMAVTGPFVRNLASVTANEALGYWGHDHWIALFAYGVKEVRAVNASLLQHRFHESNTSFGVRFNPLSLAHWRKWIRAARLQTRGHFIRRYELAIHHAKTTGLAFSPSLLAALQTMLEISIERERSRAKGPLSRTRAVASLYRRGIYQRHFNGWITLLRDLLVI